eukprot:jgi/Psemu1/216542/e_gw1.800.32.1
MDGSCNENLLDLSEDDIENGAPGNNGANPTPIFEEQDRDNGLFSNEEIADHQVYPQDTYSFLSLHGPFDQPIFFGMGIVVSFFQLSLVFMMLLSVLHPDWGTKHDDNPADGVLSNIVAANASPVVQATQFLAILSYILFADASILDITAAVEAFPNFSKVANGDKVKCMVFSSMVRCLQGFLAMFAAFLLIITSNTAVEIVLNFSAVNFISSMDNVAFMLALSGKYGEQIEEEAKRITKLQLPRCMSRRKHTRFHITLASLAVIFVAFISGIIITQENPKKWRTSVLRVEFQDKELQAYTGCYEINQTKVQGLNLYKRDVYFLSDGDNQTARFQYCINERRWILSTNTTNACHDDAKNEELAKSSKMDSFDISSSFDEGWISASGTPLDLYLIELEGNQASDCNLLGNGECDGDFNTLALGFDGGDCCSFTCSDPVCGIDAVKGAFGVSNSTGNGFPNCTDPSMVPITIHLGNFTESEKHPWLYEEGNPVDNPYLILDCEGKIVLSLNINKDMANHIETVHVSDRANCVLTVKNQTVRENIIWHVEYSIFIGDTARDGRKIIEGNSKQESSTNFLTIPECMIDIISVHADIFELYNDFDGREALFWIVKDDSGNSNCHDEYFTERFGLSLLNYSAPIKGNTRSWIDSNPTCLWTATKCEDLKPRELDLRQLGVSGTIPKFIHVLQSFYKMDFGINALTGTLPSEIGLLTSLTYLHLYDNQLTGTIPSEIGLLTRLANLVFYDNQLTVTMPSEIGLLTSLVDLDLSFNQLTETIPSEIGLLTSLTMLDL